MASKKLASMFCLFFRPLCSDPNSYGSGIQREVSFNDLNAAGCTVCYETRPLSGITSSLIGSCTGPYIFVGGGISDISPSILIGAYTSTEDIMSNRTSHLSNGVYWYYRKGHYVGFFDRPDVLETNYPAGTKNYEIHDIQHGLLWNIDGFGIQCNSSALRSNLRSNTTHYPRDSDLHKWIYNCPGKLINRLPLNVRNSGHYE
jgi:hypothetical protein